MESALIHPNVKMGQGSTVGMSSIIGEPPRGKTSGSMPTQIGKGSTIRSHSVIYAGCRIGDGLETGHGVLIRENNRIGNDVSIGSHTVIERDCTIGNSVRLHSNVFVPEFTTIKDGAWIGPNVVMTNAQFPNSPKTKQHLRGPVVEEGAKVGANSTLLPGVTIGRDALVGAGSVVTEDVKPGAVVVGNPARKIKDVRDLRYSDGESPY